MPDPTVPIYILPAVFKIDTKIQQNPIKQIAFLPVKIFEVGTEFTAKGITGVRISLPDGSEAVIVAHADKLTQLRVLENEKILTRSNSGQLFWFKHPVMDSVSLASQTDERIEYTRQVTLTWKNNFNFLPEIRDEAEDRIVQFGLRNPQVGAIHAISAHWTVSESPATIVMPTGTGKTETMLGVTVYHQCDKILVVVPTDALRNQIANKFLSIGVLKEFGIIGQNADFPVVCLLRHKPRTSEEADDIFNSCNIVVTTMSIVGGCTPEVQVRIAELVSHLFIDEAHHIPAKTWFTFRGRFLKKKIVQFTATPFRNDGQHIDGKTIFNYPLAKAQKEQYFKRINLESIFEVNPIEADKLIAEKAIRILRRDLESGLDHIMMARVSSIKRTEEILPYYSPNEDLKPVVIHSQLGDLEKARILAQILSRESKIVICVDMLGEGFDLPQLKIAALHDMHKSLGITLQFTGRFTRTIPNIGEATMVANTASNDVDKKIKALYSEDADWNIILRNSSTLEIEDKINLEEFVSSFDDKMISEIPLQNLLPKMSTVIFRCKEPEERDSEDEDAKEDGYWKPEDFERVFSKLKDTEYIHTYSSENKTLIIVTKQRSYIEWGNIKGISDTIWNVYIAHKEQESSLLYIYSSSDEHQLKLAEAISPGVVQLSGEMMFRSFSDINRAVLFNIGLKNAISGPIQYKMFSGTDLKEALSPANKANYFKSNVFGIGYENGEKVSVGCSYKGKVWSYSKAANLVKWREWCYNVGRKVSNDTLDSDRIIDGLLKATIATSRPIAMPITIEWPVSVMNAPQRSVHLLFGDIEVPIYLTSIDLADPSIDGPLKFIVSYIGDSSEYELVIEEPNEDNKRGFLYRKLSGPDIHISKGTKNQVIEDWFLKEGPAIRFLNTSYLENNIFVDASDHSYPPFDVDQIAPWTWPGILLKRESQYKKRDGVVEHRRNSIQFHTIEQLKQSGYDIIFDDDDQGEAADIITFRKSRNKVLVEFFHCKYSLEETPGNRIDDLYVVCGQAQKSIHWRYKTIDLIDHMLRRDSERIARGFPTRFETGTKQMLADFKRSLEILPAMYKIFIVQPGLRKATIPDSSLHVLGSTQGYLKETYNLDLGVISS
ncbi:DEAD/DEAH box helicase [Hymenobacter volaticus]|uniref:DEAD/DEAH box helicase family protein n=1 Tax=Hymenobacter volaticus TaxID=2932254 RepID=A0ABY4G258_9BACT|nr:DEAD/DEAH box helicase family protein [Hymenobacter volaticus]UOQ64865.1 DEAD/DEAH box helicase family protein [Hymenobacter volaticus]